MLTPAFFVNAFPGPIAGTVPDSHHSLFVGQPGDAAMAEIDENTLTELTRRAKAVSAMAYCRYSRFPVGAALLTDDGQIIDGCNVENASYGLTICAERNAVFQMVARGWRQITAIVIYTPTPTPSAPCGACRQVINEFGPGALVLSVCDSEQTLRKTVAELLPEAFGPVNLEAPEVRG